ncbi:MAG TPA: M56 family metallopeptidase [Pirellulales bacterium]|nr:M56 family metallopeptidase [Pirellulales bacterium]
MAWHHAVFDALARWAIESAIVLAAAAIVVACLRQPAKRLLVIQEALLVCLALPFLTLVDVPTGWSWHWPDIVLQPETTPTATSVNRDLGAPADDDVRASAPTLAAKLTPPLAFDSEEASARGRDTKGHESGAGQQQTEEDNPAFRALRRLPWHDARWVCVAAYVTGVALMASWWCCGLIALARLLRRATPANERCQALLTDVTTGHAYRVRLLVSGAAEQPFTFGWRRPTIVLPERLAWGDEASLRWSLAHEWAHVSRGDAWWWTLAGVTRLALFYQPLVWWLRGQIRLSQDYLADADAATRGAAVEDYAQFLTAWARLGGVRPAYVGLGILGRKSDLYRRVTMLLGNRRPLDRGCSRRWSVGVTCAGAAIVAAITTYGGKADEPPSKVKITEEAAQQTTADKDAPPPAPGPQDPHAKQLVDGVLKRCRAIDSGEFCFSRQPNELDESGNRDKGMCVVLSGSDFRVTRQGEDKAVRGRHVMVFDADPKRTGFFRDPQRPTLHIQEADSLSADEREELLPLRAGTLPSPAALKYVEEHRNDAHLAGETTVGEIAVTKLEWNVSAEDAAQLFGGASELLRQGGVLRLYVAEELGYVLPLVEFIDRFESVEARFEASRFIEKAAALFLPENYHVTQGGVQFYTFYQIDLVNQKIPDDRFVIAPIPAGTQVIDGRLKRGAIVTADGRFLQPMPPGPLQAFTVGVAYEHGLPEKLLAEMDRDVLTAAECEALLKNRPATPAVAEEKTAPAVAPAQVPVEQKEAFRYAGRSFAEWRHQLLNDLDANTCAAAMPAVVAFGNKGYRDEAIAALAEVLHGDRWSVVQQAASSLAQIGPSAVPALIEGLTDDRPFVRENSAQALGGLGPRAKEATESLVKLLEVEKKQSSPAGHTPRAAVIQALINVAGGNEDLQPMFDQIVAGGAASDRQAVLFGLQRQPTDGKLLRLLLRLSRDNDVSIRAQAAGLLAERGPAEPEVLQALQRLIRDLDQQVSSSAIMGLLDPTADAKTATSMMADSLGSPEVRYMLRQDGQLTQAIQVLARDPGQTSVTLPLLIDIVDGKMDGTGVAEVNTAIETLEKLGPAAKAAVPALERRMRGEPAADAGVQGILYNDFTPKFAQRALSKITASDDEPPKGKK